MTPLTLLRRRFIGLCLAMGFGLRRNSAAAAAVPDGTPHLGQGAMAGEVTATSALLQTRITGIPGPVLDAAGDVPGAAGTVCFEYSVNADFTDAKRTAWLKAGPDADFIVRAQITGLEPGRHYRYRPVFGADEVQAKAGPACQFTTHPGRESDKDLTFIVGSCMNYNKFMHGEKGKAGGPTTATEEDKQLGFPSFAAMAALKPDFFVGTGDIVYYDNPLNGPAQTLPQLRECWHEQFRFPRMVEFFAKTPAYWSKDDHDFRYNDGDNTTSKQPLPVTGIHTFREQLPIHPAGDNTTPTYRTHRVSRRLQIWLTEGRDHRSPNKMEDGPEKSLWGREQKEWLKRTLKESDAMWKILISPTPLVGPDDSSKTDNHTNIGGFRHEAEEFFSWLKSENIQGFVTMCGDRHWQYHSIHPSGVEEFGCGALNDENSRMGVKPGSRKGTDPEALIKQLFTSPKPNGGFLHVGLKSPDSGGSPQLTLTHYNSRGGVMNTVTKAAPGP